MYSVEAEAEANAEAVNHKTAKKMQKWKQKKNLDIHYPVDKLPADPICGTKDLPCRLFSGPLDQQTILRIYVI